MSSQNTGQAGGASENQAGEAEGQQLLQPGTKAPDFRLNATSDQKVGLADFKGKNLVMVFYPADWSPVCTDELALFNEMMPEFKRLNAEVVGISVDGIWCHQAFEKDRNLRYPLLADFEPKGAVSKAFGAYSPGEGVSERALFVIDGNGVIRWSYLSPMGVNPGVNEVLSALEAIAKGEPGKGGPAGQPEAARSREGEVEAKPTRFGRGVQQGRETRQDREASHGDHSPKADTQPTRQ